MNPLRAIELEVLAEGREWTRRCLEERLRQNGLDAPAAKPAKAAKAPAPKAKKTGKSRSEQ